MEIIKYTDKKPFLVDVPVRINIWIRPICQRKQFEVVKKARPSIIFLQSDGGRNEKEWEAIRENRRIYDEEIDWNCTIYKLYEEKNNGLYAMGHKIFQLIWSKVDRCIFTEDDLLPSVSFFRFCAEMLEKYKDDERIGCICGFNHLGVYDKVDSSYFFSRQGSIWGTARWRRTYEFQKNAMDYGKSEYSMKILKDSTKHNRDFWKRVVGYSKNEYYDGHSASTEFFIELGVYGFNQLQIIPKYNLISNMGHGGDSVHMNDLNLMAKGIRKVFDMPVYEMDKELKHPIVMIPDEEYERKRNRIMAYNTPLVKYYRWIETGFYLMKSGNFNQILRRFKRRYFQSNKLIEK